MKMIKKVFSYAIVWICLAIIVTVILSTSLILIYGSNVKCTTKTDTILNATRCDKDQDQDTKIGLIISLSALFFAVVVITMIFIKTYKEDDENIPINL